MAHRPAPIHPFPFNITGKIFLLLLSVSISGSLRAQSAKLPAQNPETYIEVDMPKQQLHATARNYSIDKVTVNPDSSIRVRLCIAQKDYANFETLDVPYTIIAQPEAEVSMATTYEQMVPYWNRYPTYNTYLAMMDSFQTRFPHLCKIDTILAQTPGGHSILVAHLCQDLMERGDRPAFFYTSTMHGDEPVGYYFLLRLIHYLLNNYDTDAEVKNILDKVDLWICPIENPDGTYHSGNDILNESPISTRTNHNGADLNRSYPLIGGEIAKTGYEPEVEAMITFGAGHHLTMSANLHGGAELFNYPWDTWSSSSHPHADRDWWELVGRTFVDTCHKFNSNYMQDMYGGITEGADWYYVYGSRQDCFNYYLGCREATIEIGSDKVLDSYKLPAFWNCIYPSLLHYIEETLYGVRGIITDSVSGEPIKAKIFIETHDTDNSHTYSTLPAGDYHRPLKASTYAITFSADGYVPKTHNITVADHQSAVHDVALVPVGAGVEKLPALQCSFYPNPMQDILHIAISNFDFDKLTFELCNVSGVSVMRFPLSEQKKTIHTGHLPAGMYIAKIVRHGEVLYTKKIVKRRATKAKCIR